MTTSPVLTALGERSIDSTGFGTGIYMNTMSTDINTNYANNQSIEVQATASAPQTASTPYSDIPRTRVNAYPLSASPKAAYQLPQRPASGFQSFGDQLSTSPRGRSLPSHHSYGSSLPPYPEHPPQHVYGVMEPHTTTMQSRSRSRRSASSEFTALDTLAQAGDDATSSADNVLLSASNRGLHVFRLDRDKHQLIGRLEALRGKVISARILAFSTRDDSQYARRPLVVVIIHGPMLFPNHPETPSTYIHDFNNSSPVVQYAPPRSPTLQPTSSTDQYQTTVEVYSLRDSQHITTLFKCPPVPWEAAMGEKDSEMPLPVGGLSLHTKGRFVVVSSGVSGEIYIFETENKNAEYPFRCIGKTWSSVPNRKNRTLSTASGSPEAEPLHDGPPHHVPQVDIAMLSLSNRWLAIVPPSHSTKSTIHGRTSLISPSKACPGLHSHTSPSQPAITCKLDTPLEESRFNRVARDVTQEVLKGARWVGDQGMQAWKNYWNKPSESTAAYDYHTTPQSVQPQFPPTHAHDDQNRASHQPTVISIIDLEKSSTGHDPKTDVALQPIATFPIPTGCSFVSFSPTGLSLLTASAKGDVQYVWDLMRMAYGKPGALPYQPGGPTSDTIPTIRQVARYTRVTTANIVDVIWSEPQGDKLAIVTDRGTVHIHDLPHSAFQWPPPPRSLRPITQLQKRKPDTSATSRPPGGGWSAAINAMSGGAQPLIAAVRGNPLASFGGFNLSSAGAGAGVKGGKMVATGFSKSVGAATDTMNTIRHLGENRLHVPGPSRFIAPGSVRWLAGKHRDNIAVIGGGICRVYAIIRSDDVKSGKRRYSVVGELLSELTSPIPAQPHRDDMPDLAKYGSSATGFWPPPTSQKAVRDTLQPLSHAEIETSSPYQPFHTDSRMTIRVYYDSGNHDRDQSTWVFGEDVPAKDTTQFLATSDYPELAEL